MIQRGGNESPRFTSMMLSSRLGLSLAASVSECSQAAFTHNIDITVNSIVGGGSELLMRSKGPHDKPPLRARKNCGGYHNDRECKEKFYPVSESPWSFTEVGEFRRAFYLSQHEEISVSTPHSAFTMNGNGRNIGQRNAKRLGRTSSYRFPLIKSLMVQMRESNHHLVPRFQSLSFLS